MKKRQIALTSKDIENILTLLFRHEEYSEALNVKIKKPFLKWMKRSETNLLFILDDMDGLF